MTSLRVALANVRPGVSPADALAVALEAIAEAGRAAASIVCFPECYIPGYRTAGNTLPPPDARFLDDAWSQIARAAEHANVAVILGTERIVDGCARITTMIVDRDGSVAGFQDKVQLDPSEEPIFVPGSERRVFEVDGVPFGISICHEGWRYPETVRWSARRGAKIVFHPHFHEPEAGSFRPTTFGDPRNTFHEKAMLCRAAENTIYFASVNCAIDGSPTTSAIVNPDGSLHSWQPYGLHGLLVQDLDLSPATGLLAARCRTAS